MQKLFQTGILKQTLKVTAQMQQSINMLQMSSIDLNHFVTQELAKNPFLEEGATIYEEFAQCITGRTFATKESNDFDFLSNVATGKNLKDIITEQIHTEIADYKEQVVAYYLLYYLNQNGYIVFDINEAADHLKCDQSLIYSVLTKLQTFDPPGIFARNLRECLMIQLNLKSINSPQLMILLDNLELLANRDYKKLAKICNVDYKIMQQMITTIKTLNPKPANGFLTEQTISKIPDVILSFEENGAIKVEINEDVIPKLHINHELLFKIHNKKDIRFAKDELRSANLVINSIKQRTSTILHIANCIVEAQINFFKNGIMYLKPLTLQDIAKITGFNESTISRSTVNKYIATPIGIYELKYFFSSKLGDTKSLKNTTSSIKAKELVKQLIIAEGNDVLSDDDISRELRKLNINIARRTVTKYRKVLKIPSSNVRKKRFVADTVFV